MTSWATALPLLQPQIVNDPDQSDSLLAGEPILLHMLRCGPFVVEYHNFMDRRLASAANSTREWSISHWAIHKKIQHNLYKEFYIKVKWISYSDFEEAGEWAQASQETDESSGDDQSDTLRERQETEGNQIIEYP